MKLFQNPIVVTVLAGLALGLVLKNVVFATKRNGGARPQPPAAAEPGKAPTVPEKSESKPFLEAVSEKLQLGQKPSELKALPSADVDVSGVWKASQQWTASPRRDPFQLEKRKMDGPSAGDLLKLSGTWRQTDSTLAVLNNRVVSEGESILGYRIAAIEEHRVWVEGPNGREPVDFRVAAPARPGFESEPLEDIRTAAQNNPPKSSTFIQ